ncbi:polyketide synthase dehydratase domain-containing protein [Streptomyces sp. AV19]|uniref:beta-ketoacyl synthase N-terminal-like domain-containing protein n=1 Tax=Streptomyces sp. AV19 TaxID=2793068 RepID=UPI0018FE2251|nr:beta-ketoacyl synthase N-terminal-like domain-containing protein [Streptomyces sp. AV19]MBH1932965.1 polyketide synthase dehydratase domain-containing protein [Streptomyces sp. AV19]MDG4533864.1 polyketide synthase dehydratase domain-containing protein [Streptomyces sp. AV19]
MTAAREPVAVVGMAVTLPGAGDLGTYWRNLVDGVDAITDFPAERWHPEGLACRRGGFVDGLVDFDPAAFGIMPTAVRGTEPDQLIALRTAAAALADAHGALPGDRTRVGIVLGRGGYLTPRTARLGQRVRTSAQLVRTVREVMPGIDEERLGLLRTAFLEALGPYSPGDGLGLVPNFAASRVANRLDLRGPAYTVDAACASSLVAVDHAVTELARGRCDVMLAGGVHHCHDATLWSVFTELGALSPSQRIRPFHRDADGMLLAEGTGIVVLKRLTDARGAGDRVYALVRGVGIASDGRTASLITPDPAGQARAVRLAWAEAGLDPTAPGALGLLEAHGTGTPGGDATELAVLAEVFGRQGGEPDAVIGSVKSMIGHTMPAAGAAGMIKAALAIHHGVLPPTLHCDVPHPALPATRFRPTPTARPWEAGARRAAVNAFGFGGINAHLVLEEPPGPARGRTSPARRAVVTERERVLRLAARTPQDLAALLDTDDAALRAMDACGSGPARLAIAGPGARQLALARKATAGGRLWGGRGGLWFAPEPLLGPGGGRTAFLFPGLEAEFSPQVDDVARHFGAERPSTGQLRVGDVGGHTAALFDVGELLTAALDRMGIRPDAVAGHSAGEWTAMIAGGIFRADRPGAVLRDAVTGRLRLPALTFLALGAPAARIEEVLPGFPGVVLSHDDAPHQCVVCGPRNQLEALAARLGGEGVLGRILPFRSGFHTPMLAPHLDALRDALPRLAVHPARTPVWSGTLAAPFPDDEAGIRELFVRHLLEPVRFRQLTEAMHAAGFRAFVQVGTGQLPALVGDTLAGREHLAVTANSPRRSGLSQLDRVAAALWTAGLEPDFTALGERRATPGLDLGAGPVSLDPRAREQLRAALGQFRGGPAAPLHELARRIPAVAELEALLTETATTAAALYAAAESPGGAAPATARTTAPAVTRRVVEADADHMPYLLDHCFYRQRPGWPELADRWPVVPATTIVQLLLDAVGAAGTPVAVRDARFLEWAVASPPVAVELTVTAGQDRDGWHRAAFGRYARADIRTAADHPEPPVPWACDGPEAAPSVSAREMYERRWMFHGPRFQGVTDIVALGERHVRAVLTCLDAPGALLDNVGQLLGYWLMATGVERVDVLPVGVREIVLHGPRPSCGSRVACDLRITRITDRLVEADAQLVHEGRVWAGIRGWRERRFDSNPTTLAVQRKSDRHTLSAPQPGGWQLVFDHWPDPFSLELMMRCQLAGEERAAYASRPMQGRRQWLLGRIAAKDAVRRHLWGHGEGPVFPGEVRVRNEPSGRPRPEGVHGRRLPPVELSLAHCREAAVALVRPGGTPAGIDVEEITDRPAATHDAVLAPGEHALFERLGGGPEQMSRLWAAKEAAAKAEGTGLRGNPHAFLVTAPDPDRADALTVRAPSGRSYAIRLTRIDNPPGLPPRSYAVAWTSTDEVRSPEQMNGQQP